MLVAAAVCPHPPLLFPDLAAGAAAELDPLRAACAAALDRVASARPTLLCLAGSAEDSVVDDAARRDGQPRWYEPGSAGSFAPYGVPAEVVLGDFAGAAAGSGSRVPRLPLSLTVGAWLLRHTGWTGAVRAVAVPAAIADADLARCAAEIAGLADRVALLVLGDGTARRSEKAPGYIDDRAAGFDAAAAAALAAGNPAGLLALDRGLGAELLAAGITPWHLLGHAGSPPVAEADWHARLHHDDAPYGVAYLVASWLAGSPLAGPPR